VVTTKQGNFIESQAHFTQGVKAKVQFKSSVLIAAKVEISPKRFTLGLKSQGCKDFGIQLPIHHLESLNVMGFGIIPQ
jgi:hypothetical protein